MFSIAFVHNVTRYRTYGRLGVIIASYRSKDLSALTYYPYLRWYVEAIQGIVPGTGSVSSFHGTNQGVAMKKTGGLIRKGREAVFEARTITDGQTQQSPQQPDREVKNPLHIQKES